MCCNVLKVHCTVSFPVLDLHQGGVFPVPESKMSTSCVCCNVERNASFQMPRSILRTSCVFCNVLKMLIVM